MEKCEPTFPSHLFAAIEPKFVSASQLHAAQYRLDAPAFLSQHAFTSLIPTSAKTIPLSKLADVFTVYIQSPILAYVSPFKNSRQYVTTSELADYQSGQTTHVSLQADPRLIGWEIKRGTIVVSRSGRVGEAYLVDKKVDGVLVGDSFRVVPKDPSDSYFLYAVLSSEFARSFLSGSAYGSVIDHASLDQLRTFPLPLISKASKALITERIAEVVAAREEAYDLLDEAQQDILSTNSLPPLPPISPYQMTTGAQLVSASEVLKQEGGASEFRLEAHFHNPVARAALGHIRKCPSQKNTLAGVTHRVFFCNRFTRTFVNEAHGMPYLAGKDIVQIRPRVEHFLSTSLTEELNDYKLRKGWILITCSGTLGRTSFVWKNFEKYVGTHDLIRVIPEESQVDPGYLYAFLSSNYGYEQILRFRHGSVIDHVTPDQVRKVIVPLPPKPVQEKIGDKVRLAYEKRAEALKNEGRAHEILIREIKGQNTTRI